MSRTRRESRASYLIFRAIFASAGGFRRNLADYFHIVDTLATARAFGIHTQPHVSSTLLDASVEFDPYIASVDKLIDAWLPLTFAFNSINRSPQRKVTALHLKPSSPEASCRLCLISRLSLIIR